MGNIDAAFSQLDSYYRNTFYQYYNQRKLAGTEGQGGSRTALEKQHRHPKSMNVRRWAMGRETAATEGTDGFLQFWVNPSECSWSVGLRSAFDKTHGGAIHHEIQQLDRPAGGELANFTRFDLPSLQISFQAGVVTPGGYNHISNGYTPNIRPHGLGNFYDFINMIDRPNITSEGLPNYINIMYVSATHGERGIWLRGFFDENGISWTDSAENPNTITSWTASFLVCHSNPPLNQLRRSFRILPSR